MDCDGHYIARSTKHVTNVTWWLYIWSDRDAILVCEFFLPYANFMSMCMVGDFVHGHFFPLE
jgi:hypothetical protein